MWRRTFPSFSRAPLFVPVFVRRCWLPCAVPFFLAEETKRKEKYFDFPWFLPGWPPRLRESSLVKGSRTNSGFWWSLFQFYWPFLLSAGPLDSFGSRRDMFKFPSIAIYCLLYGFCLLSTNDFPRALSIAYASNRTREKIHGSLFALIFFGTPFVTRREKKKVQTFGSGWMPSTEPAKFDPVYRNTTWLCVWGKKRTNFPRFSSGKNSLPDDRVILFLSAKFVSLHTCIYT